MRVQRSADCAGCPSVVCPVCRTSFRCFCVVSDMSAWYDGPDQLPVTTAYHLFKLVDTAARAAIDLEQDRQEVSVMAFDTSVLTDAFHRIADGRMSITRAALRSTLLQRGVLLSEHVLSLLWYRYARPAGGELYSREEITFRDFVRQIVPRGF